MSQIKDDAEIVPGQHAAHAGAHLGRIHGLDMLIRVFMNS